MMSCMFGLFSLQVLKKLVLVVLDFWIFSQLAILYRYLTWRIKHATITVHTHFHWNIYCLCHLSLDLLLRILYTTIYI